MNKKQSSIDWLAHEMASLAFDYIVGQVDNKEHNERFDAIKKQAKEMHEKEIYKAYNEGYDCRSYIHDIEYGGGEYWEIEPKTINEYYEAEYGGDNE